MKWNTRAVVRYVCLTGLKLSLVALVAVALYAIYLDSKLTQKFSTSRYQAPALVYGRALQLQPEQNITIAQVRAELQTLGYRQVGQVRDTGEYSQQQNTLTLYRRPFDFADGPQMAQKVQLIFAAEQLAQIRSLPDGRALSRFELEPPYLGRIAGGTNEDRLLVGLERVPSLLIETLLLVEDRDFYHHSGISLTSIGRAALANLAAMDTVQGGSTLTQQLVKNLYLTRDRTLWRKANEALMALIIDYRFSKNEILETYLNEVYFGQDGGTAIHGVGLASRYYFGKQVEELAPAEIALLVAIVKGPSYYNPVRYPERARQRRDMILQLMYGQDLLNKQKYLAAIEYPLVFRQQENASVGDAPHYLARVKSELQQISLPANWQQQGLRVFTMFDPNAQAAAEQALVNHLDKLDKGGERLQGAVVLVDHETAGLVAVVGDRDARRFGFNRAEDALRPIGSLIKPFIYGLALADQSYQLASVIEDSAISLEGPEGQTWSPQNFDVEFKGPLLVYDALAQSRNVPAVKLGLEMGLSPLIETLRRAGVTTPIPAYPSLTLGSVAIAPMTIAEMYTVFAQGGQHRPLAAIQAVTNHDGLGLYERKGSRSRKVFNPATTALVQSGLQGVINEGTGKQLAAQFGTDKLAGKSGTTNDYRDSWFVAFDGRHVVTAWVGRDDNQATELTGSTGALPVVAQVFASIGVQPLPAQLPEPLLRQTFHPVTGQRIPADCDNARVFPSYPSPVAEDVNCSGEAEQSWWDRWF